jgi:putative MATE family efflux protein
MDPTLRAQIAKIAIPVSLESCFQLFLGFVNQVIVGTLGTVAIAAVGLSNNLLFIGILSLNTLGSGCAILASRAKGRGDEGDVERISALSLVFGVGLALVMALPLALSASPFLQAVGADANVVAIGGPFLGLTALALPFITASIIASAVFRTIGQARLPMVVTMTAVALNPLLAWLMVVPLGMGANGAAYAMLITQGLRAVVLVGLLFRSGWGLRWNPPNWTQARAILGQMMPLVIPLFITEIVFSGGIFLYALLVERIGTAELAAFQILNTLEPVFITASVGLNSAATILVAQAIGRGNRQEVWQMANAIVRLTLISATVFGVLFALCGLLVPPLFPNWAIGVSGLFQVVKVGNMVFFGLLSSGGDTRFLLFSDFVTVFVIGLPVAYVLAFPLGLGFWGIILGRVLFEETVRVGMFVWRYRQGKWFNIPG